jgi:hypothetical protein
MRWFCGDCVAAACACDEIRAMTLIIASSFEEMSRFLSRADFMLREWHRAGVNDTPAESPHFRGYCAKGRLYSTENGGGIVNRALSVSPKAPIRNHSRVHILEMVIY